MADTEFGPWIGRSETHRDSIDLARAWALHATLDGADRGIKLGAALPPLWHWIYFWQVAPLSQLDGDGHPKRGGFLPPITLPRRMWAGGRLHFYTPIPIGAEAERRSTILRIDSKSGKSGALVFLTVQHDIWVDDQLAIAEEQDIVYRDHPTQANVAQTTADPIGKPAEWSAALTATAPLLFRYSALTMNAHRIHYDLPYATGVEHYPELVLQGPLAATLLADLAAAHSQRSIASFSFRGVSPILAGQSHKVCGTAVNGGADLWISDSAGRPCMTATASWRPREEA